MERILHLAPRGLFFAVFSGHPAVADFLVQNSKDLRLFFCGLPDHGGKKCFFLLNVGVCTPAC